MTMAARCSNVFPAVFLNQSHEISNLHPFSVLRYSMDGYAIEDFDVGDESERGCGKGADVGRDVGGRLR